MVVQIFRRAVNALNQTAVQTVEGDGVQLIYLGGFGQHAAAVCPKGLDIHRSGFPGGGIRTHAGVPRNGHHSIRQHMDVCLYGF